MTKSERTRHYILEKTAPVFNKYGFDGASLAILQEVTGLTKGSLYGNFADKEEIAKEAFRYSMNKVREVVRARIAREKTAAKKLLVILTFYAENVFRPPVEGGCPLLNTAIDADDHHGFMRKTVKEEIDRTISYMASLIDEGKKSGEFMKNTKSRELATVFFASVEGALMISRVSSDDAAMKHIVRHCKVILDSITRK